MATKSYSLIGKLMILISLVLMGLLDTSAADQNVKDLDNVYCETPHESVVALDPGNHRYFPYFVKLHRCAGSGFVDSPSTRHCVPSSYEELNIRVFALASNYETNSIITVKNHTRCINECVNSADSCDLTVEDWNEDECACKCRYQNGPPEELACKEGFRWNKHTCRCECARAPDHCPHRMIWSNEVCGCRCRDSAVAECTQRKMGIDVDCNCVNVLASMHRIGTDPHYHMFITLLIGQAAVIIILICALVHWVRKKTRQNSTHSPLDRSDSNKTNDEIYQPYLEVTVESESTDSLKDGKYSCGEDDSYTAPLSPKNKETDL